MTAAHVPDSCKKLTPTSLSSSSLLPRHHKMLLLRATTPFAYAKVDKVDADEAQHRKAQFLIHKVLEESSSAAARRRPALARGACRVKARIGVRLKRLRLAVRSIRLRVYRSAQKHLRNLRRLVHGEEEPESPP